MASVRLLALRTLRLPLLAALTAGAVACVFQKPLVKQLDLKRLPVSVNSPVKAHVFDGSTVVYPGGVTLADNTVSGTGGRYALGSSIPTAATPIPLDSIVGMETYDRDISVAASVFATAGVLAASVVGATGLAIAIFGSCPTIYADSAGTELLQAEGFSYSIAPLFEQRDVDRLRLTPTADGRVVLHVRNEALETHYINHVELMEVRHDVDELALPDQGGHALAVRNARPAASVSDRAGRNISGTVAAPDGELFSTDDGIVRNVTAADLDDYIDIAVAAPRGVDSIALVLDMRNSLLNTVLLYDHILGAPGIKSLDWLGKDLGNISNAVDMGRWYTANMGMRVSVRDGAQYRRIARLGDSGPIAFHKIAVLVPAVRSGGDSVHIRLSFVADDWRIDAIAIAESWRRPSTRTIPASRVAMSDTAQNTRAAASLRDADTGYLITSPGQAFAIEFDVGAAPKAGRSWFVASQGYYTEWVRGSWIRTASGKPFTPTNESLVDAIRGWRAKQDDMERRFYSTRISAR
ncbi:MAG: hypothetical protein ABI681_02535 [Gemmatimonadales bacterium]